ncbi:protein scribble homolog isoform X3 [Clytia hemisphaerica]|uniref:PDZ domain-containing protein n=1 Tax=Clytia hemisphaerica TaxID=252671 RepID=A0A7M5X715_9CNID
MFKCGSIFSFRKRWGRWQPRHLEYLDKSHCSLTLVGEDVLSHERTLEELSLEANQIQDLPKALFRMYKLRRLILADNEILDISSEIGNLISLEELDISKNDFRIIPDSIEKLKNLTHLDVSNNTLGEVPDAITKLGELRTWVCNDIALGEIPPEVGSLSNLVILELRDNCLKFLPMSFSFLSTLERLDLGGNELEELPDFIGQLSSLIELWLDNNFLTTLPPEIGELRNLQCLDVSENRVDELPEEIYGLQSLTDLILSSNVLHELPEGIGKLSHLQILKLDSNEIDELTEKVGNCTEMSELILTDNVIEYLPSAIGRMTKLTHMNIDRNRLFTLPPEIGKCVHLSVLSARDNQIAKIPDEIGNCKSMTVLALSGNKLENLPLSISTLHLKALWLSQNQSQSVLKLQVEEIEKTQERVLTCFLFPQERLKAASLEDFIKENDGEGDDGKVWKSFSPSAVTFGGNNADDENKESNLQRRGTPYPKDLRDRHPHLIRKRSGSQDSEHSHHSHHNEHERNESRGEADPLSPNHESKKKGGISFGESPIVIKSAPGGGIGGMVNPAAVFDNPAANFDAESEEHDNTSDHDYENSDTEGRRRVGFDFVEDEHVPERDTRFDVEDDDVCRLTRKDTPHHLKGKRIGKNDDDSQLQNILQTIRQRSVEEAENNTTPDDEETPVAEQSEDTMDGPTVEQIEDKKKGVQKYTRKDTPRPADFAKKPFEPQQDPSHIFAEEEEEDEDEDEDDSDKSSDSSDKEDEEGDEQRADGEETTRTITKVYEEISVTVERDGLSLGINIAGGLGTTTFDQDEEGVYISKITSNGPADRSGALNVGDKIIKVNEQDLSMIEHSEAVKILRVATSPVSIVVLREVTDQDQIDIALSNEKNVRFAAEPEVEDIEIEAQTIPVMLKRDGKGLGFSIAGGKGATPYRGTDEGVYISRISENGPAALDKRLQVGDKLLSINGVDVRHSKHEDIVKILTSSTDKVSLVAYREKVINKKMRPMSEINGGSIKTFGESTKAEDTTDGSKCREEPRLLVEEITLKKSDGPLGLSIVGGSDHSSHPFGVNEPGIFISKVNPTGQAAKTNLCVGDRILRVNEKDMQQATHHEAVAALISNDPEIKLLVRHDPPPPGIQEIMINKKLGEKLGISIRGGAKGHPGNPLDKEDEGIFVSKVNSSGAAARDDRLKVGMRILEVNNTSLLGATHVDAVRALRTAGDNLSLIVCDGYDESDAIEANQENVLYNPSLVEPISRFSPDSQSSATSGDSVLEEKVVYQEKQTVLEEEKSKDDLSLPHNGEVQLKRSASASEQRAIDAEKRAKWRQQRMEALENDAKKAQAVIMKHKALSSTSLESGALSAGEDNEITFSTSLQS